MLDSATTPLTILLGFAVGVALYGMLLLMVLRHPDTQVGIGNAGSEYRSAVP